MAFVFRRARPSRRPPGARVCLTLALAVVGLAGQTPPPGHPPPPAAPAARPVRRAQDSPPTFTARVDLVTTDVIARDNQGLFVADLKKDEFEVLEDGVPQKLVSFTLVHGGRVFNVASPPPPAPQEGIILPPSRPTADAAGRILLFVVDDLHLDFRNTGRLRELFKKIRTTLLHDGDMWGMVSTGPSSIAIDVNYDMKRFDEAMKKISGSALKPNEIIEAPQSSQGPSEVRYRAHVAFSTAYDLVSKMEKINNRRKAVVYVSNGYDFNPFPDARAGGGILGSNQFDNSGYQEGDMFNMDRSSQQFADADLARELSDLTRAANRANTSFYTIDPRGLIGGPGSRREGRSGRVGQLRPQEPGQPARHRRRDRRLRRRQPERLRQGAEADRRRDQRLLRHRLLLDATPTRRRRTAASRSSRSARTSTSGRGTPTR